MLVFQFIFVLLWRDWEFLSRFCNFLGFRDLKETEKHGLNSKPAVVSVQRTLTFFGVMNVFSYTTGLGCACVWNSE
jgi:hypothetical protein